MASLSREDAAWLDSLRPWLAQIARHLRVNASDVDDLVQEVVTAAAIRWHACSPPPELPERTARRRYVAGILIRISAQFRAAGDRAREHDVYDEEQTSALVTTHSAEGPVAARDVLRRLERATTAERWRVWLLHEVDGVEVSEIARQEGQREATIYNRLRLARADFMAALGRDAASAVGPLVRRTAHKPRS